MRLLHYICLSFCIVIHSFGCQFSFTTIDTAIIRSSRPVVFCNKEVFTNFAKFTRKHLRSRLVFNEAADLQRTLPKKEIPAQIFSCEFCKISHNTFYKEPFRQLLPHKHSFCLLSHHEFLFFSKTMSHIFSG